MGKYILPKGWTPIETPWYGIKRTNVLLSNGEIISDRSEWESWERYQQKPFKGMDRRDAYPVAWQEIEPLKLETRPAYYIGELPEWAELRDLCAIRSKIDNTLVVIAIRGKAAENTLAIFEYLHNLKVNNYDFPDADK